jgi:phage anti-repressor protein
MTQEIIPVGTGRLGLEVSSITLHGKLGSKQQYADWIKNRIKRYGFEEGIDFFITLRKINSAVKRAGRPTAEYIVTLDVAKELAMLEENEAGRAMRRYFIEVEKQYRDWIGMWLPKLETDCNLFDSRKGYNYGQLLLALGSSTSKSAFYSRIKKNRQEFWKNYANAWYVSEEYGKNIILYTLARKGSSALKQRRIEFKEQKPLIIEIKCSE